jgi:hypothetical protein
VARSILLQTGLTVDLSVARALSKDVPEPASNKPALELAFDTICHCLGRFINSIVLNRRENETLVRLAVQELLSLANRNPGSRGLALTKSLWSVARYDPRSLVRKYYVGILANKLLSPRVVRTVKRITRVGSALHETQS